MKKNIILGAAVGYDYRKIEPFLTTLRNTNFEGDVCLLVSDTLSTLERQKMSEKGALLITVKNYLRFVPKEMLNKRFSRRLKSLHKAYPYFVDNFSFGLYESVKVKTYFLSLFHHIACSRYGYFYRFLLENNCYQNVLLTDVRDVVFQDNPFNCDFDLFLLCALENSEKSLGSDWGNAKWIREAFGEEEFNKISHCRISCSGTTLGSYEGIQKYLATMINSLSAINHKIAGYDGFDQGVHNYLIWNNFLPNVTLSENGKGPVLTMHGVPSEEINIDDSGVVRNNDGSIIPVLHQYDRHCSLNLKALQDIEYNNSK